MNRILIICFLSALFCLTSCNTDRGSKKLPLSVGGTNEILFVMHEYLWKGSLGDSIRQYFSEHAWGLPAPEPMFVLTHINTLSNFMQKFRNIILVNIDPKYETSNLRIINDVFATNQLVVNIDAFSADSVVACIKRNKNVISAHIVTKGREAIIADYVKLVEKSVVQRIKEKFEIEIVIPKPYKLDEDRDNFAWISREQGESQWGILIWEHPYLRASQLETDSLIFIMNDMTRKNVPGSIVGSYMADEPRIDPFVSRYEKNGIYTVQLNGLWQMENGFMGGPYVNHTIVDIKRGRLITGHGFVFYPNRDKLLMVRQLEAILHTMMPAADN